MGPGFGFTSGDRAISESIGRRNAQDHYAQIAAANPGYVKKSGLTPPTTIDSIGSQPPPDALDAVAKAKRRATMSALVGRGVDSTLSTGGALTSGQPLKTLLGS